MAYQTIQEGAVTARVPEATVVSKEMEVFYNPVMKFNRDLSVLLLKVVGDGRQKRLGAEFDGFSVGSPLAGSGVRECRILAELDAGIISSVEMNDYSKDAAALIKQNLSLNKKKFRCSEYAVQCEDASLFLQQSKGFDYIDIDPFGTPNPYLDAAAKRISRDGILALTATDTSALAGTYPDACMRKYWAVPLRNHLMHEVGIRILIRKVQLVAAQYDKALIPIYSYSKDHYVRVFLLCTKGKKDVDEMLKRHEFVEYDSKEMVLRISNNKITSNSSNKITSSCNKITSNSSNKIASSYNEITSSRNKITGSSNKIVTTISSSNKSIVGPLWTGPLWDEKLARGMASMNRTWQHGQKQNQKLLDIIALEAGSHVLGFYQLNVVRRVLQRTALRKEELLKRKGVWPTHFDENAVRAGKIDSLF